MKPRERREDLIKRERRLPADGTRKLKPALDKAAATFLAARHCLRLRVSLGEKRRSAL